MKPKQTIEAPEGKDPATPFESTPARSCARCGARLTNAGRKSSDGMYWCATKTLCVRAKQRHYYAKNRRSDVAEEQAPKTCASCGCALPPRAKRITDSPYGRWCRKANCKRNQEYVYRRNVDSGLSIEESTAIAGFVAFAANPENVVICPECELGNAVKGYVHPKVVDGSTARCTAVGDTGVHLDIVKSRWSDRYIA